MKTIKHNDFTIEAEQDRNSVTTYFIKVDELDETASLYLNDGFKLLQGDLLNRVLTKCSTVQNGIFDDEYTVYTDIVILTLK